MSGPDVRSARCAVRGTEDVRGALCVMPSGVPAIRDPGAAAAEFVWRMNSGGPSSRTRTERVHSTVLGDNRGPIHCPPVLRVAIGMVPSAIKLSSTLSAKNLASVFCPPK